MKPIGRGRKQNLHVRKIGWLDLAGRCYFCQQRHQHRRSGAVDLWEVVRPAAVESRVKAQPRTKASALDGRHADVAAIEEQDANEAIAASTSSLTGIEQSINQFAAILFF
jgi:hypothetical protein